MADMLQKIFDSLLGGSAAPPSLLEEASGESQPESPYGDLDALRQRVRDSMDRNEHLRWTFERLWFKAIMFYIGNQWITWDGRARRWREKKLRKWIPKPVTNRLASTADSVSAAIQSTKVAPSVWPATDNHDDIATAEVGDKVIPVIDHEINVELCRESAANWITLNGDVFAFCYYDKKDKSLGETTIQSVQCQMCSHVAQPNEFEATGACPGCGNPAMVEPAFDELGQPVVETYPIGRLKVDMLSPLEVYLNMDVTDPSHRDQWTIMRTFSLETVKRIWPESGQDVNPDAQSATKTAKHFMEAIAYMAEGSEFSGVGGGSNKNRCTLLMHFEMPCPDYPDGLWVVMASDETILEAGPSPFYDEMNGSKRYFNPLVKIPYKQVPGRVYAKTPIFDLLPKQEQLNRLESLIELAIMKGVHGTWLLPTGSSISALSGEPATVIRYTPSGTGGAEPKVVTNAPFDAIVLEWKKQIIEDFEELAGTFDALKGNVPRGVSAGYAIQLLTERSYGRFAPVFSAWERGWVEIYSILLRLFKTYATEERLHKIKGYSGSWEIQKFKGADLTGSVDVRIEGGSSRPKSKLAEQALIESLAKLGVLNPTDPEQQYRITQLFGMSHIMGAMDDDVRAAAQEWDELLNGKQPLVKGVVDNHIVHINDHKKRAKSDLYSQLPPETQMAWQEHIFEHMLLLMPMGQPQRPGGSKPPGGPAGSKANENGDKTMNNLREGGSSAFGSDGSNQYQ